MTFTFDDLQAEAERLGFTLSGVTRPDPPPHYPIFERWLEEGRQASMGYLESGRGREARRDPKRILLESRSIIAVGMRYSDPRSIPDGPAGEVTGRVAAYAWGDDYHDLFPPRLRLLQEQIEAATGKHFVSKIYTDTGPILERDLAQRAGLGWAGKNTCLIAPRQGSYFLLGELFTEAEIEPNLPFTADLCGSCRRCIEACPTGCILPDRTIDSGRCISYLTIENKGAIPEELREKTGDWIFGCDICQMVCPWNLRFSDLSAGGEFHPRLTVQRPVLREELRLTPQEFNRKFKGSPVLRAKRRGYLRNVAVALGNQGDPTTVPDLARALAEEAEPLVRGHAAWALGKIGTQKAREALERSSKREEESSVLSEVGRALTL